MRMSNDLLKTDKEIDKILHTSYENITQIGLGWDESDTKELSHLWDKCKNSKDQSFSGAEFQKQEKTAEGSPSPAL